MSSVIISKGEYAGIGASVECFLYIPSELETPHPQSLVWVDVASSWPPDSLLRLFNIALIQNDPQYRTIDNYGQLDSTNSRDFASWLHLPPPAPGFNGLTILCAQPTCPAMELDSSADSYQSRIDNEVGGPKPIYQ